MEQLVLEYDSPLILTTSPIVCRKAAHSRETHQSTLFPRLHAFLPIPSYQFRSNPFQWSCAAHCSPPADRATDASVLSFPSRRCTSGVACIHAGSARQPAPHHSQSSDRKRHSHSPALLCPQQGNRISAATGCHSPANRA